RFVVFVPGFYRHNPGWVPQKPYPVSFEKGAAITIDNQRRAARHGRVVVAGSKRSHAGILQAQRSAPGVHVLRLHLPRDFPDDVGDAAAEITGKSLPEVINGRLVVRDGEGRTVEEDHRLAVDHRPMPRRDEGEEVADAFVEPFAPAVGGQVDVLASRIVAEGARVVKMSNARRLFARLHYFTSGADLRSQHCVDLLMQRGCWVSFRGRTQE